MKVAGFTPNSFVDYPGNIAAVIFFGGCNFDCWFCHNRWLLSVDNLYDIEEILKRIETNNDFLDAVVLSGGEATLQNSRELIELIKRIKARLKVKRYQWHHYQTLKELLPYLDYVAMDIKRLCQNTEK